jgi:hypothetical protein
MLRFVQRHVEKVTGVLHGFDRLRFRGTLRNLMFIEGMSESVEEQGAVEGF